MEMQESHKDKQANKKNLEAMIFTQGLVRPKQTDKKKPSDTASGDTVLLKVFLSFRLIVYCWTWGLP